MEAELKTMATTKPSIDGEPPLPRRTGPKGLLPSTWTGRSVKVQYMVGGGAMETVDGTLLDWSPFGPIFSLGAVKTAVSWEQIATIALVED